MAVHSVIANDASVGTTIGTFDPIDARNGNVRLRDGTTGVVGISYCAVRAAQTTGTAMMARLRLTSADLGVAAGAADFVLAHASGGGIATQSGGWGVPARWIPVDFPAAQGNVLNYFLSQMGIEPADNLSIQVGTAHVAGQQPPSQWYAAAMARAHLALQGSISSNGGSTTTARTSLTAATIPSRYTQLVSIVAHQAQDAVQTTAEPTTAFIEVESTIGNFEPQEWPTSGISPALAGTLVGLGLWVDNDPLPFYFVKGATSTQTVEPFVTGLGTQTAANAYGYGIGLRY